MWKAYFPKQWQEIDQKDELTGEVHIADIKTPKGIVLELQNSPMDIDEMQSRENFYKEMVWVINGSNFISQFHILDKLPDPLSEFSKDLVFYPIKHNKPGRVFYRRSENPGNPSMVRVHSTQGIKDEIEINYSGHHQFEWIKPRIVWLNAKCPVYIDFDDDFLWQIMPFNEKLVCVKKVIKKQFIADYLD